MSRIGKKPIALPKGVTPEELATAKKELEAAKVTWDEATKAANQGNPGEARDKVAPDHGLERVAERDAERAGH